MLDTVFSWVTPALAQKIAVTHGTPTHVLSLDRLRANYEAIDRAFAATKLDMTVLYSVKTNYIPIVVDTLRTLGCGADVVSGPELELALSLGFPAKTIAFNGPHKTDEELEKAVSAGVRVNIDSVDEGLQLARLAESMQTDLGAGLRINPGVAVYLGEDPTFNIQSAARARQSKFGFTIDDGAVLQAIDEIGFGKGRLRLTGLHCHLGSQITDEGAFVAALDRVFAFAATLRHRHPIAELNIGGGFGVGGIRRERFGPLRQMLSLYGCDALSDQKDGMNIRAVAQGIAESAQRLGIGDMRFFCEPGRVIVSDAMSLIASVTGVKRSGGLDWLVLDAGLNLMPTIAMAESHRFVPLTRSNGGTTKSFRIAGPLCYEGDVLTDRCEMPADMARGDLVAIEDSGAYTVSRSTNFIRPRAAVVAVFGDQTELCWRRETYDDIFTFHVPTSTEFRRAPRGMTCPPR